MHFHKVKRLVFIILLWADSSAFAADSFNISIDTSSLANSDGYLYFQYVPLDAANSTATVSNFSSDGLLGLQTTNGVVNGDAVSGTLPNALFFANTNGINDYNQGMHFGDSLSFLLSFSDPGVGGLAGGSSSFSLGLFTDAYGNSPLLTSDGSLFSLSLMNDVSVISQITANQVQVNPVPIPAASWLFGAGFVGLTGLIIRKQNQAIINPV